MSNLQRISTSATALLASTFLLIGCASAGDSDSNNGDSSGDTGSTTPELEVDAAWLDEGRMAALVTWGSSSCVPVAEEATSKGQTVSVALSEGEATQACTADFAARASLVGLPEGVTLTEDVKFEVSLNDAVGDVDLDGNASLAGVPGDPTDFRPSAGWFDDGQLVLLTWGSSSCQPIVDEVTTEGNTGTVTFVTEERPCTMDMAPRATIIDFGALGDVTEEEEGFTLTLIGDNLDATLEVIDG